MTSENVAELLLTAAEAGPSRPAILGPHGAAVCSFGGLAAAAEAAARDLLRRGVGAGDRVAIVAGPGPDAVLAVAAVLWAGATAVIPPGGRGGLDALRRAADLHPRAVLASPLGLAFAALVPGLRRAPVRAVLGRESLARASRDASTAAGWRGTARPAPASAGVPAVISFTTGTTGEPRPVARTNGVLRAQHAALDRIRPAAPGDVDLAGLPMLVLHDLGRAVTTMLPPRGGRAALAVALRRALRAGATTAGGLPTLGQAIVDAAAGGSHPNLRAIHIGGGPVPPALVVRLRDAAPNATVSIVYGATEAEPIAAIDADDYVEAARTAEAGAGICVGRVDPGLEVRIDPLEGGEGASWGRLLLRGPQVAAEVREADAEAAMAWLDTGDLVRRDDLGRLWLLGRAVHAIGHMPPLAIEQAVEAVEGVAGAAVMPAGPRDAFDGILAIEPMASEVDRATRVATRVAAFSGQPGWPRLRVVAIGRLPRDARSGTKVDYARLRVMVGR